MSEPSRCPYCHAAVERAREAWVACRACLAPHHDGCWREGARCAGCGERRFVGQLDPAPASPPAASGPRLALELRGRRAHLEGVGGLRVEVGPDAPAALEVVVTNATDRPARVSLRALPAWLRAAPGPDADAELPPGKSTTLRATLEDAAVRGRVVGGEIVDGELVVGADDDARTVEVELVVAAGHLRRRRRRRLGLAGVTAALLVGHIALVASLRSARIDDLALRGVMTTARVTRLTPSNHNQMYFEFTAEGTTVVLNDFARGEAIGDPVEVTYLPGDPAVAVRGRDADRYVVPGPFTALPFVALMFATVALVATALLPPRRVAPPKERGRAGGEPDAVPAPPVEERQERDPPRADERV